jgi:hypothetical protein
MYAGRRILYEQLEADRGSKVLAYVTGDRPGLETQIHPEVLDHFVHHLDLIGPTPKITLYLYTRGGNTLASWSIANLIRQFADEFEVIVPFKAHSGGTLICLGANSIMMTKQATLGPIDPSVNGPLNPQIPGAPPTAKTPVSVEAINGFFQFAKEELGVTQSSDLTQVLVALSEKVHPLVLGEVYRTRAQIRMLAERLLSQQVQDPEKVSKILGFLCSESGSHDYTIYRREARDALGLNIEKPTADRYALIKQIYADVAEELKLSEPFDPNVELGAANTCNYSHRRGLVESVAGGSHSFRSEGALTKRQVQVSPQVIQEGIEDRRMFEGWKHETA